ncbi:filamentous hemagglutinin N-terminal domain-containing protein [Hylemonella gracilis]|uniref:Filamentous hemagglutinin N-terminal domain-containing protein n=1 Tax=Hylemonella gracilis TaxID=80880 RepID=A0A4P6UF72_9BURK|nr:hemagglutinin repeat-containing protein [Hylemonella gracilis]QBK03403.1 filamentous hemagglutinin N-terminal domain-containing protein [Hylemonella gracilis]
MNRQCYQLIFNRARGALMAVGEDARATGQGGSGQRRARRAGTTATTMAALLLGGWALHPLAWAQIVADPTAPGNQQATVLSAPNGVPLVNIQTPSAAGVSRNTYSQFDVKSQGVILNNSRGDVQTQLGGWVQGNPWLASGGSARVILNEVNSSKPSSLNGWLEVAGQRAEVVIANPAGIQVNGAGFINAGGVTLTTGTPVFNGGTLEAYRVQGGRISFGGNGLDARGTDYTAILARAVDVNAGIWADRLNVVIGANQVNASTLAASPLAASAADPTPAFALDVSQLGGMYAGQIHLIGTEAGVGVNQRGVIAATAGNLVLQANGQLTNVGVLQASGPVELNTQGGITNTGRMLTEQSLQITSDAGFVNSGEVHAQVDLSIKAAVGASNSGQLASSGRLIVDAQNISNGASGSVNAAQIEMTASALLNNQGSVQANGPMVLNAQGGVTNAGQMLAGQTLQLTSGAGFTNSGAVQAQSDLSIQTTANANNSGQIASSGRLIVDAQNITNGTSGSIGAAQVEMTASAVLSNQGSLQANGPMALNAQGGVTNTGQMLTGQALQITSGAGLINNGTVQAQGDLSIQVTADASNSGQIASNGRLVFKTQNLGNTASGTVSATQTELTAIATLDNRGVIDGEMTRIEAQTLRNSDTGRVYGDQLNVNVAQLHNENGAVIAARATLNISAQEVHNSGSALIFSADSLNLNAKLLDNDDATVESLGGMVISVDELRNTNTGLQWRVQDDPSTSHVEYTMSSGVLTENDVAWTTGDKSLLPKGSTYAELIYKVYYENEDPFVPAHLEDGAGDRDISVSAQITYSLTDPIWARFGLTPPATLPPVERRPALEYPDRGNTPKPASVQAQQKWDDQAAPWLKLNALVQAMREKVDAQLLTYDVYRTYTETTRSAVITKTAPGRIVSGGDMQLRVGVNGLNQDAQIIAGGMLHVTGKSITNQVTGVSAPIARTGTTYRWGVTDSDCNFFGCTTEYGWKKAAYAETITRTTQIGPLRYEEKTGAAASSPVTTTGPGPIAVSPSLPSLSLPGYSGSGAGLYQPAQPGSRYLVETDPRFTNQRLWLSSDYMLQALSADPATTQKRLGDGFYEQKLIREQVMQLTGQRFLGDYSDDQAQYQALLDAGATFAQQQQLSLGVALSAEQVAALTSDVVWLVQREVALPDGSTTLALVPQVYLAPREGDLAADGKLFGGSSTALIAGRDVSIDLEGELTNSGSIAGRQLTQISAQGISNLGGSVAGNSVSLQAEEDIRNVGGTIGAQSAIALHAGGDIEITTTTMEGSGQTRRASYSGEYVDRVAALYVSNANGVLVASAGNDVNLTGAIISSAGSVSLSADNDINLNTVQTGSQSDVVWNRKNYVHLNQSDEVGSQISAGGDVTLNAGNDIYSRAGSVQADGVLTATAGHDITLEAGMSSYSMDAASYASGSSGISSGSTTSRTSLGEEIVKASAWGGETVNLEAKHDLIVAGSQVIGDKGTSLSAGNDLSLESVETRSHQSHYERSTQSGFSASGGTSVSVGSQSQSLDQRGTQTQANGSTVGSTLGNVTLTAGKNYTQTGSNVLTPNGDISIEAETVQIGEARETSNLSTEQKFSQGGLSLGLSNPMISALQGMSNVAQATDNTDNERMKALGAATLAMQANQMLAGMQGTAQAGGGGASTSASISVSIGSSSSKSTLESQSNTAHGSQVMAGGNISIRASGAGVNSGILIQGSDINAKGDASLSAEGDVALLAARNYREQHSDQSSSNASVGVSYGMGSQNGFSINLSAGFSQGSGDGEETVYTNTHVNAKNLSIHSGGDVTLKGAVAEADQIKADIGGDLKIESLQNYATYTENSQSAGFSLSLCIPPICYGTSSVSGNYGQTNINSNYKSVTEQSGLRAGDGGFQVNVAGHTSLIGGSVTSTDKAVQEERNSFLTASLTTRDIKNEARYQANASSFGAGTDVTIDDNYDLTKPKPFLIGGNGSDGDKDRSVTTAGISGIAGHQDVRTGDKEAGIPNNFDLDEVLEDLDNQVVITQAFDQYSHPLVDSYAEAMYQQLQSSDPDEAANWADGGTYRALLQAIAGGFAGSNAQSAFSALGAVGSGAWSTARPEAIKRLTALWTSLTSGPKAVVNEKKE